MIIDTPTLYSKQTCCWLLALLLHIKVAVTIFYFPEIPSNYPTQNLPCTLSGTSMNFELIMQQGKNKEHILSLRPGVCNHAAQLGQMHITSLVHRPQLHLLSSAGLTTCMPPTEDWQYPFKIWTFSRATKLQLPGHFWPAGHGLHSCLPLFDLTLTCEVIGPQVTVS